MQVNNVSFCWKEPVTHDGYTRVKLFVGCVAQDYNLVNFKPSHGTCCGIVQAYNLAKFSLFGGMLVLELYVTYFGQTSENNPIYIFKGEEKNHVWNICAILLFMPQSADLSVNLCMSVSSRVRR